MDGERLPSHNIWGMNPQIIPIAVRCAHRKVGKPTNHSLIVGIIFFIITLELFDFSGILDFFQNNFRDHHRNNIRMCFKSWKSILVMMNQTTTIIIIPHIRIPRILLLNLFLKQFCKMNIIYCQGPFRPGERSEPNCRNTIFDYHPRAF